MSTPQGPNPGLNTHHEILIADAATMQTRYTGSYTDQPTGGFFYRGGIDDILAQTNCIGLRYYFMLDGDHKLNVIIVGVEKATYNDLIDGIIIGNAPTDTDYADGDEIPETDQSISAEDAAPLTADFRANYSTQKLGGFFFRSIIDNMIDIDGTIGLRYKFGLTGDNKLSLIINPVDESFFDTDIYNQYGQKIRGDQNCPCPNFCGEDNVLNSTM